ncbi:unnamed protein product [Gongylonema pulchrum]|uniref:NR LBD domain-containing protein n=1 Tax=Gongylonema pulchrum TaxID=637853 RepID=A0A183EAW1_9BILA|nr:unnamed protein product [Gongylonema pulchrum]
MIIRQYKIYYHVRHQLIQAILNAAQRLMVTQSNLENRRLTIDVCEMLIKWEQWRLKQIGDWLHRPIDKIHVDFAANLLLKIAVSLPDTVSCSRFFPFIKFGKIALIHLWGTWNSC